MLYADDVVMSVAGYAHINPTPQMDWHSGTSMQHLFVWQVLYLWNCRTDRKIGKMALLLSEPDMFLELWKPFFLFVFLEDVEV